MEMEETFFACSTQELSCIIGNLFVEIDAPCDIKFGEEKGLVICGTTHSGKHGFLTIHKDYCVFRGCKEDFEAVKNGVCVERRCKNG